MTAARGQVITFYSFKGGTGRSMAVANVGCLLAKKGGCRVLLIDFDLEAPGLHRYFPEAGDGRANGVMELMADLDALARRVRNDANREVKLAQIPGRMPLQAYLHTTRFDNLDVMPAGFLDDTYGERVATFDWPAFYLRAPDLLGFVMDRLGENYTHILVDSRTGFNDISGLCTAVLPEKLVFVFTPNRQNLDGAVRTITAALAHRRKSNDLRPLIVYPLPSRIENAEPVERDMWRLGHPSSSLTGYQMQFEELLAKSYGLETCNLGPYFDDVQVQHVPFYAYGEKIATEIERSRDVLSLSSAYQRFIDWLEVKPWAPTSQEALKKYAELVRQRYGTIQMPWFPAALAVDDAFVRPQLLFSSRTAQHLSWPLVTELRRLEIEGGRGTGKTTLLYWLAAISAQTLQHDPEHGTVPIFFDGQALVSEPSRSFSDLLRARLGQMGLGEQDLAALRAAFTSRLQEGSVLVLIDDVDSVMAQPQSIGVRLREFVRDFPRCAIVTTRRLGPHANEREFVKCTIAPLDEHRRKHLIAQWIDLTPGTVPIREDAEAAVSQVSWASSTPLLLGMTLHQLEQDGSLSELDICRRYLEVAANGDARTVRILEALALTAFEQHGQHWLSIANAEGALDRQTTSSNRQSSSSAVRDTGIVVWQSDRVVFAFPAIAEYLAAWFVVRQWPSSSVIVQQWLAQPRMRKRVRLFRFLVQLAVQDRDAVLTALIEPPAEQSAELPERVMLAARVLSAAPDVQYSAAVRVLSTLAAQAEHYDLRQQRERAVAEIRESKWRQAWDEISGQQVRDAGDYTLRSSGLLNAIRVDNGGDHIRAIELYGRIIDTLKNKSEEQDLFALACFRRGGAYKDIGDYSHALGDLRLAADAAMKTGDKILSASARLQCARLLRKTGRDDEALEMFTVLGAALLDAEEPELLEVAAESLLGAADIQATRAKYPGALTLLDAATRTLDGKTETPLARAHAEALLARSDVLVKTAESSEAIAALDEIASRFAGRADLADLVARSHLMKASLIADSRRDEALLILDRLIHSTVRGRLEVSTDTLTRAERLRDLIAKRK